VFGNEDASSMFGEVIISKYDSPGLLQCPRTLRHPISSLARTLGSWI
jgi:hypothetical protein